jgi:YVTN family beta-propeller protein
MLRTPETLCQETAYKMKLKLIGLMLLGIGLAIVRAPSSGLAISVAASLAQPQGNSPFAIAITQDGQHAYLSFDLSEVIFKVRLTDLTVVATADLSAYFPMESESIALDASEGRLFVYTPTWRKLLVLDTETMTLIGTIDDFGLVGMFRSQFGSQLVTWDGGSTVQLLDSDTYSVTQLTDSNLFFTKIQEEKENQTEWYVAAWGLPGGEGPLTVGLYDHVAKSWSISVTVPLQAAGEAIFDFRVLPNGQKAYVATFGGWYPESHAYGWLYAVDLTTKDVKAVPIDGGAMCLETNLAGTRLYVGTGWPLPNTENLLVVDTTSDSVVGSIPLGQNAFGWPYTQMNDLLVDPAHPSLLYATSTDGNALIKMDVDSVTLEGVRVFNNESLRPPFFVRRQAQSFGNILTRRSAKSFEFDLDDASIRSLVAFPAIRQDADAYDIGVLNSGRLLIAQGEYFLEVDPQGMQLVATHPIPLGTPSLWQFVLSNDKSRIYAVTSSSDGTPNIFIAIDTATFQEIAQLNLAGGSFEFRPFELPDGSKLYALGGLHNGAIVVHVIGTTGYAISQTITFAQPGLLGISAGPYSPYAYDPVSRTLFVGATNVVLAIDTSTDVIKKVIYLGDAATAIGLQPSQLTYISAVGLVYNPTENYLYIAHLDRSFVSVYDLTNDRFLSEVIPLQGYFPYCLFANDAYSRIYSLNMRSDSVSVIDVLSKTVEKVIDLHDYLHEVYLPITLRSAP